MKNKIETSIAFIEKLAVDLIKVRVKKEVKIDRTGLEENLAAFRYFLGDKKAWFLTRFHALNTADVNARASYEADKRVRFKLGEAFVIESLSNRIELDFHIQKTKTIYPIKIFKEEEDALEWINLMRARSAG